MAMSMAQADITTDCLRGPRKRPFFRPSSTIRSV